MDTYVNGNLVYKECDIQISKRKMDVLVTFFGETHPTPKMQYIKIMIT